MAKYLKGTNITYHRWDSLQPVDMEIFKSKFKSRYGFSCEVQRWGSGWVDVIGKHGKICSMEWSNFTANPDERTLKGWRYMSYKQIFGLKLDQSVKKYVQWCKERGEKEFSNMRLSRLTNYQLRNLLSSGEVRFGNEEEIRVIQALLREAKPIHSDMTNIARRVGKFLDREHKVDKTGLDYGDGTYYAFKAIWDAVKKLDSEIKYLEHRQKRLTQEK